MIGAIGPQLLTLLLNILSKAVKAQSSVQRSATEAEYETDNEEKAGRT